MPIVVELQSERRPGGNAQIAQSQIFEDEVKIVVQAFGIGRFQETLMRLLVVPWFVRRTWFHGRKDMDQAGMCAALFNDLLNTLVFSEVFTANEFDL